MSKILRLEDAETIKALGGTLRVMFTPKTADTKNLVFSVGYFAPGEILNAHIHPESEEVYYVLKGKGKVYLGKGLKEIPIEPNVGLYIPPGTVHGVANTGRGKLLIAFFVTPGKEPPKEYKK